MPDGVEGSQRAGERQLRHDLVISALAVVSVGIGAFELVQPTPTRRLTALDVLDLAIVAVFIVDFVRHARQSGDWRAYVRRHWWELPSLIPVTGGLAGGLEGIGIVRGVRLVRLARAIRLLRVVGAAARLRRVRRYVARVAGRAQVAKLAGFGAAVILLGGFAAVAAESGQNPRLSTVWDGLWWSLNLFTTVAYLDFQPRTVVGKAIGAALMVVGVAFIGVFTASLAGAILVEPGPDDPEAAEEPTLPEPPID